ncbi:hypothetical protein V4F87_003288 [Vibrio parahaemolyticus]|nr:hypothetical protein [Vibrio parahaemolyticus]
MNKLIAFIVEEFEYEVEHLGSSSVDIINNVVRKVLHQHNIDMSDFATLKDFFDYMGEVNSKCTESLQNSEIITIQGLEYNSQIEMSAITSELYMTLSKHFF